MIKSELRVIYLEKQRSLSGTEIMEKSRKIADAFFDNFTLENIQFLHVFLPIEKNREIETSFIVNRVWNNFPQTQTIVSRVNFQSMTLENLQFNSKTKLARNRWHILEPTESELFEIEKIDAILIPLLCFDERGFRVGYGKGFYDKFLSQCRPDCSKIGLSYFAPIAEISDAQNFDVRLDFCITPQKVWKF
jgi:5-formyltetrahydrofolate cyclo-ligase